MGPNQEYNSYRDMYEDRIRMTTDSIKRLREERKYAEVRVRWLAGLLACLLAACWTKRWMDISVVMRATAATRLCCNRWAHSLGALCVSVSVSVCLQENYEPNLVQMKIFSGLQNLLNVKLQLIQSGQGNLFGENDMAGGLNQVVAAEQGGAANVFTLDS